MKPPVCVIGIDGGATRTVCRVMDINGILLGTGISGSGNILTAGPESVYDSLCQAIAQAVNSVDSVEIGSICLGMAGSQNLQSREILKGFLRKLTAESRIPVKWLLSDQTGIIVPDYEIALAGASPDKTGIVTIAGTGSVVFGRNPTGQSLRVGGWGYQIGDEGSAYFIAMQAIRTILNSYDRGMEPDPLTELLLSHFNSKSLPATIELIHSGKIGIRDIASFAPMVDGIAAMGDRSALAIVEDAVFKLAASTKIVIDRLYKEGDCVNVYTAGSVWDGVSGIRTIFQNSIARMFETVNVEYPVNEPSHGACLLALKAYLEDEWIEEDNSGQ